MQDIFYDIIIFNNKNSLETMLCNNLIQFIYELYKLLIMGRNYVIQKLNDLNYL